MTDIINEVDIQRYFKEKTVAVHAERDDVQVVTEEYDRAGRIIKIDTLVRKIKKFPDLMCFIGKDRQGRQGIECTDHLLFNNLKRYISEPDLLEEMYRTFRIHRLNPNVELFNKVMKEPTVLEIRQYLYCPGQRDEKELGKIVDSFNRLFERIRKEAECSEFITELGNYLEQSEKIIKVF